MMRDANHISTADKVSYNELNFDNEEAIERWNGYMQNAKSDAERAANRKVMKKLERKGGL